MENLTVKYINLEFFFLEAITGKLLIYFFSAGKRFDKYLFGEEFPFSIPEECVRRNSR